jgi:hypothetical protein
MDDRLRAHDGEYRWIQDDGTPRHDRQGNFLGYIGHCLDITGRKRAEEEINRQLEELQRWHEVMLGREDRVGELKGEINQLCRRAGEQPRYPSQEAGPEDSPDPRPNS